MSYLYKHGNFMVGAPDSSLTHKNIMNPNDVSKLQCQGCDAGCDGDVNRMKAYYSRSSGTACPCTGPKCSYTRWFQN